MVELHRDLARPVDPSELLRAGGWGASEMMRLEESLPFWLPFKDVYRASRNPL